MTNDSKACLIMNMKIIDIQQIPTIRSTDIKNQMFPVRASCPG